MIRYIKQTDSFRCGPVAIINSLKWAGNPASWRTHKKVLDEDCNITNAGVCGVTFKRVLRKHGSSSFSIVKQQKLYLKDIDQHLDAGGVIIFAIKRMELDDYGSYIAGHYTICIGKTRRYYKMVNYWSNSPTTCLVSRKTLNKHLKELKQRTYGLFLKKK